jgi:Flp pilus assembly protein TadD
MFSSRNIHFAILGIILGATSGYIFAFYQVQSTMPPPNINNAGSGMPADHPAVNTEQMLTLFKEALNKNPNDTGLMTRYGNFLFDRNRFGEAVEWYEKVLALEPNNTTVRTDMGTALWNMGEKDRAMAEYQKSLQTDPNHMLTLANLFMVQMEGQHDIQIATDLLTKMERIDPSYPPLPQLRKRLEELKAKAPQ